MIENYDPLTTPNFIYKGVLEKGVPQSQYRSFPVKDLTYKDMETLCDNFKETMMKKIGVTRNEQDKTN